MASPEALQRCHDSHLRCALRGAAQTVLGVRGCCTLAHSPQGCFQRVDTAFGWQDADFTETITLCTKLCEDEIVHGGEDLLRRTLLEAREFEPPVLFVLAARAGQPARRAGIRGCSAPAARVSRHGRSVLG